MCRSACADAQSDQHLCYSLFRQYDMYTCYIPSFKILASLCSLAGWFESYLVANSRRLVFVRCGSFTDMWPLLIWATSWENLYMPQANNKGADQPATCTFVIHYLYTITPEAATSHLCSWAGWFESYLVANPLDRFSCDMAHTPHSPTVMFRSFRTDTPEQTA